MQPERTTAMMVALPLFGYKLPQMYIDMTILHDSTTWYIYEYITTVVVDESIHFLPYSKGVNTIIKRPFSAQPSTRPASLIGKKTKIKILLIKLRLISAFYQSFFVIYRLENKL